MGTNLKMMSDILFRDDVHPHRLQIAASRVFSVDPDLVSVADAAGSKAIPSEARIVLLRESQDMPGDFPIWYGLSVDPVLADRAAAAVSPIARALDTVLLTDAEDDQDMTLHLPDGSSHVVHLEQDGDDAFRITPEMGRLIERARGGATGAEESPTSAFQIARRRKAVAG